jgi:sigma-B regulation protein RsbU (phosphoserine phosphatase)
MKSPIIYVRKLLSVRLSLWIVLFAALIFIGALKYLFTESKATVREEAISHANQILDNTVQRVNNILERVEVATNNTDWLVTSHLDDPDVMYVYSRRILQNNPDLNGCSIAFEPYFFKKHGLYYSVYSERRDGQIHSRQEGKEDYQYFSMDWYLLPQLLDRPCWTEPYIDLDPDSTYTKEMIISYCKPLKDKDSTFVGVISTDISLSWLSQVISAVKPYPNSYSIMTGRGCTYLVHPDSTKLFFYTIFTETLKHPNAAVTDLGHAMHAGEDGMKQMVIDGKECYVFYKPLKKIEWSVAIVCPEDDIFSGFNRLRRAVSVIVMIGLLLMLYIVSLIITKELKPLRQLARQTKVIASGQFDEDLPDNGRIDEIGNLAHSFGDMQHSLIKYIDELKDTTAQKERIESELRIARDIQMSMVPAKFPKRDGLDMYAIMTPAKEVGGDLYGYVMNDDKLYFCVGDVSGKGVPASLFMAQTTRLFRTLATKGAMPTEICTHMNDALSGEDNKRSMFVTMFVGLVDLKTGFMKYCNAGHNAPLLGNDFMKMVINMPIGMMPGLSYKGEDIDSIKGQTLFIYSDGLNEALNNEYVMFGDDRLLEAYRSCKQESAHQMIETLTAEVEKHRDGAEPNDDLTMMCLKIS